MFPAHAGMSRVALCRVRRRIHVPRTRGDEPVRAMEYGWRVECSPHTRG